MTEIWIIYTPVLFLIGVSVLIILLLFVVSFFLSSATTSVDFEKLSTYECGFDPFSDTQGTFDIKFYLLALLFMIFDLEIMFLLPWSVSIEKLTTLSFFYVLWFFIVLVIAFVYEWLEGALDWQ